MSRNILLTFSGSDYDQTTKRIVEDGPRFGATDVYVYDDVWLTQHPFFSMRSNRWLWEHQPCRGFGWFAWKMVIALDVFDHCDEGDALIYMDADCAPVGDMRPVFDRVRQDGQMFFAASGHINRAWVKRDAYIVTACTDVARYVDVVAGAATCFAIRAKAWEQRQFLYEWLTYSVNPQCTTKDPSTLGSELPGFHESRDEQALMTLLCHKYGYPLHREPSATGEDPRFRDQDRELYGQFYEQIDQTHSTNGLGSRYRRTP